MNGLSKAGNAVLLALVVFFLALAQTKSIINNFDSKVVQQIQASEGVVKGLPHWRLYQSRILGPYMVHGLNKMTDWGIQKSYVRMIYFWSLAMFAVLIAVAISLWQSKLIAVSIAAAAAFLNSTVMQGIWLYPWDFIDFMVFTVLLWAILKNKPIKIIAAIIIVETFNREAAIIIAGWLILDALVDMVLRKKRLAEDQIKQAKQQLMVASSLAVISAITIETLRNALLIREIGPEIFNTSSNTGPLFAFVLFANLKSVAATLFSLTSVNQIYNILIFAIPTICVLGMRSNVRELYRASSLFLIFWAMIMVFGLAFETRVWVAFVPFLVLVAPLIFLHRAEKPIPIGES